MSAALQFLYALSICSASDDLHPSTLIKSS